MRWFSGRIVLELVSSDYYHLPCLMFTVLWRKKHKTRNNWSYVLTNMDPCLPCSYYCNVDHLVCENLWAIHLETHAIRRHQCFTYLHVSCALFWGVLLVHTSTFLSSPRSPYFFSFSSSPSLVVQ